MEKTRVDRLREELEKKVRGDVVFDDVSRFLYSTDASIYKIKPLGVILPRTRRDLVQAVRTAAKYGVAILPRGGGTSLAGQTVTDGLVIDCSKHLTNVLEVNPEERWVRVEPGIVLDNLNDMLASYGLFFAPDVATSSRATVGGMIGNNSAGVRSIRYGRTVDNVLGLSVLLSTGEELELGPLDRAQLQEKCSRGDREGEIYGKISRLVEENRDEILQRYPKVLRRVGGYNLDELLDPEVFNLAKLVVGSEGTLVTVTEARLSLEPIPSFRTVCVLHFDELVKAIDSVKPILNYRPTAVEILDEKGLQLASENPTVAELCSRFIQGNPTSILMVEFTAETQSELESSVALMRKDPVIKNLSYSIYEGWEPGEQATVWAVRKNALGVLLSLRGDAKPLPFIEDSGIPVKHLSTYIRQIIEICRQHERDVAMYAHASVGVIHVRPILSLKRAEDVEIMKSISAQAFELVVKYGGSWSGEHGDGLVRSYKNPEFFGPRIFEAFRQVKSIFDPLGVMNPGKIVETPDMAENLRIHPGYHVDFPKTYFRFEVENGFDQAIEMCTGVGQCRKTLTGFMCPSYMATRDEEHSTRGRANALRSAISGDLGPGGLTSPRLYEVLDLCLECKACKTECPSSVDMSRMKSEFLAHYHEQRGLPRGKRLFGQARWTAEMGSKSPRLANIVQHSSAFRWLMEKTIGLDKRRILPDFAGKTFSEWYRTDYRPPAEETAKVAIFADTFVNFHEPRIGIRAVEFLSALNIRVELIEAGCCGRPLISCGFLSKAREQGLALLRRMEPFVEAGIPVIVLEPSCLSAFRDDYLDLIEDRELALRISESVFSLEELLLQEPFASRMRGFEGNGPTRLLYHGHCQQKALWGTTAAVRVLGSIPGAGVEDLNSGCCGMAGSFGYEKKHYSVSRKIGERILFPSVRNAPPESIVVAPGFSCRLQIRHFTEARALHPAEVLSMLLAGKS